MKLKADQPCSRDYLPKPSDYRHTEKYQYIGTIMIILCSILEGNCVLLHLARARTQTNGQTGGKTLLSLLSPCFAVTNNDDAKLMF